jgi:hypothetical protein
MPRDCVLRVKRRPGIIAIKEYIRINPKLKKMHAGLYRVPYVLLARHPRAARKEENKLRKQSSKRKLICTWSTELKE